MSDRCSSRISALGICESGGNERKLRQTERRNGGQQRCVATAAGLSEVRIGRVGCAPVGSEGA